MMQKHPPLVDDILKMYLYQYRTDVCVLPTVHAIRRRCLDYKSHLGEFGGGVVDQLANLYAITLR